MLILNQQLPIIYAFLGYKSLLFLLRGEEKENFKTPSGDWDSIKELVCFFFTHKHMAFVACNGN